jgi:hypothetical protein
MRRPRRDGHARFADLEAADAMMQRQSRARPSFLSLVRDSLERFERERLVRLVLQISNAAAGVVIANEAEKRDDRSVRSGSRSVQRSGNPPDIERRAADCQKRNGHDLSIRVSRWGETFPPSPDPLTRPSAHFRPTASRYRRWFQQ